MPPKRQSHRRALSPAKLEEMIEDATVDAYGESEQIGGFLTMLEEPAAGRVADDNGT